MKLLSQVSRKHSAAVWAGLLLFPSALQAAQMAYEGFDYPSGTGNLSTLNGGSGWSGAWQTVNNGSADVVSGSMVAAVNSPAGYDARSTGNSANLPAGRRVGRLLNTSNNGPFGSRGYRDANGRIGADGTTLYISFMQQPNGTGSYYEFEFHRDNLGDGGRIGGIGNDQGGNNVNLRAPNGTHTIVGPGSTGVNFYVVRIDFKAGNDDVYVYQNPTSATEPGAATLTRLAASDMSFNGVSFGAFIGTPARTVAHDEVRFGQTWADVTLPVTAAPAVTHQPQPSTTVHAGGNLGLVAAFNGFPEPTYQWYRGTTLLSGQTSPILTLSNVQPADAGAYHLTATNTQGDASTIDAAVVVVQPTPTGLLAYEGFDYDPATSGLEGKSGGLGWGAPWAAVDGGGGSNIAGSLAAGTNAPNGYDLQSLGNSSLIPNAKRSGRLLDTSPTGRLAAAGYLDVNNRIGATGKTLYLSFLQQPDGTSFFYEFEFHRDNLGDPGRIGGIGNDTANPTVALRTGGTTTLIGPGSTGVNLYVVRIDFKDGNDDVYVYQNPVSATEPATATLTKLSASDMSFNGLSMGAFVNGRTVKHDEIRLGQSWSDVVFGTSRRSLTWAGDGSTNAWNFSAPNWNDGVGATAFVDGDPVTFDDSGSDTPAVTVPSDVATASITVANDLKNYTLGGAGTVSSSGGLTKSGLGSLTLTAPADFGSAVVVNGGDLALNGTASIGGDFNINSGAGMVALGGTNTFTGSMIANGGTVTLGGTNTFSGLATTNANLTITGPTVLTGGSTVWIGNLPGANSTLTLEAGGSLTMTGTYNDSWVVGRDGGSGAVIQNGGTVTYNPSNRDEAYIGASTSPATVASYTMAAGNLEMSTKRLTLSLGPVTSTLTQNGGSIQVRHLQLGATLGAGPGTGIYNLNNGVMTIGTGGITSVSGLYEINLAGGTIAAAANWSSTTDISLTTGNVTIDTADHGITLTGAITGPGGLIKTGTGTLITTGFKDFSGPTAVNAGKLGGSGNDFSALSVASGAVLAPGDALNPVGTFYAATAAFAAGSTFEVEIDGSGFADALVSFGAVDISGAGATFTGIGSGIIPAGTELVILDYTGASLTGTFAGLPEGASVSAGSNTFSLSYNDSSRVTLTSTTVVAPYQSWAALNGLDGSPGAEDGFDADPENDGVANGLEWILGGDPLAADSASLYSATGDATNGLTLTFTREEASLGAAAMTVQWNAGLDGIWTDVPVDQDGGSYPNGVTVTVNEATTPDEVTVNIPAANAPGGRLFGRIKATLP
jgi:Immunoglobulin domain